ncbi:MAG: phosphoglycerate mutase family protein [Bacteroidota bacterium]
MIKQILFFLVLSIFVFGGCNTQKEVTTFYLVRHAEKMSDGTKDPPLNDAGEKRSLLLADLFSEVDFDAIYTSDFKRTRSTATPISDKQDKVITLYDPHNLDNFKKHLFQNHKGQQVLIVGHSNTTPNLVNKIIGKEKHEQLDESEYDKIFIVKSTLNGKGKSSVLVME